MQLKCQLAKHSERIAHQTFCFYLWVFKYRGCIHVINYQIKNEPHQPKGSETSYTKREPTENEIQNEISNGDKQKICIQSSI